MAIESSHSKFFVPQDWGSVPDQRRRSTKKEKNVERRSSPKKKTTEQPRRKLSVITDTIVRDAHHILSKNFFERTNNTRLENERGVKIRVSHLDHAFIHYATWILSKDKAEFSAFMGQASLIEDVNEADLLDEMMKNEALIAEWGNPETVLRRMKNLKFIEG